MKLISIMLLALVITGCSEPVHNWELKAADKFCKDQQSEIDYVVVEELVPSRVICMDGSVRQLMKAVK